MVTQRSPAVGSLATGDSSFVDLSLASAVARAVPRPPAILIPAGGTRPIRWRYGVFIQTQEKAMTDKPLDVIALLKADHRQVEEMFKECGAANATAAAKEKLAEDICEALTIHAQLEEEVAYPAFREAGVDARTMHEAEIEHATFEPLVEDLEDMQAADEQFDATVKVLSEYVKHHVKEEESEMFPKVKATGADLIEIGQRLADRKRELMAGEEDKPTV